PIEAPAFDMQLDWNFAQLVNYLRTWSGVQRYLKDTGRDPVGEVEADLRAAWGTLETVRAVNWPLKVKIGAA
ncbi:MAG TPA: class I SAM-dependent methyltransferase, partial [Gammaproteobacteria bacterium]|nr:class I SAM-dependent methyltransferase [Gammaproteobacteria bacterium]